MKIRCQERRLFFFRKESRLRFRKYGNVRYSHGALGSLGDTSGCTLLLVMAIFCSLAMYNRFISPFVTSCNGENAVCSLHNWPQQGVRLR